MALSVLAGISVAWWPWIQWWPGMGSRALDRRSSIARHNQLQLAVLRTVGAFARRRTAQIFRKYMVCVRGRRSAAEPRQPTQHSPMMKCSYGCAVLLFLVFFRFSRANGLFLDNLMEKQFMMSRECAVFGWGPANGKTNNFFVEESFSLGLAKVH